MADAAKTPRKPRKLTPKQKEFIQRYIETGNGTQAALEVYDVNNNNTARSIASENLTKPAIVKATQGAFPEDYLNTWHKRLFKKTKLEYFIFPFTTSDREIIEHLAKAGLDTVNIEFSDKGKRAFYSVMDESAVRGALDMAYKITGKYTDHAPPIAPTINYNLFYRPEFQQEVKGFEEKLKSLIKINGSPHVEPNQTIAEGEKTDSPSP